MIRINTQSPQAVCVLRDIHQPLIDEITDASVGFHSCGDGRRLRYALLWPKREPRGTIVIAAGRREFIEKKYYEIGQDFIQRGYRIILFEWRGQGLSDRFLDGDKRQRDYISDFSIHQHDLSTFFEGVVYPNKQGPILLNGHSMGSHLLLRWVVENPSAPIAGVILTAPMLALAGGLAHTTVHALSWSAIKLGYGDDYASAQHDYNQQDKLFTGNPLTHDPARFTILEKYFKAYPDMVVGGVTWEWLHAATKSMQITQRRPLLEQIKIPVLTLTGSRDRVTPFVEMQRYLDIIPHAENVIIPGALHDIMGEVESSRADAWTRIDRFLVRIIGGMA
jgi:lysophospholipase